MKSQNLYSQGAFFLLAGIAAVSLDFFVYKNTLKLTGIFVSKILGFYSGVLISFLINSSYTFRKRGKKFFSSTYFYRYIFLLTVNMFINVLINYSLLNYFHKINNVVFYAFLVATLFSMILNFIGMKLLVFK